MERGCTVSKITIDRSVVEEALDLLDTNYITQRNVEEVIADLRAALEQPEQESIRNLLISGAALAVAAERSGQYQGASWVADAVLGTETAPAPRNPDVPEAGFGESAVTKAVSSPESLGTEWAACTKLPVTVHVRYQRPGETHVSTREGITPVKPDDLIMRGVSGEEYPIGRAIFEQTYRMGEAEPTPQTEQPVGWVECDGSLVWNNREAAIGRNLYTSAPTPRKPLTAEQIEREIGYRLPPHSMNALLRLVNGITGEGAA